MKRIATLAVILLMALTASAHSIRYFTHSQATRTVRYLNMQNEMMIYCGYDYEIETYVLINEVWMERVNSAYYEIWVFGYDAYTGDEVYMPLDLECVWLFSSGRIYNAAQYLRFHATVRTPHITWYVPAYNPYTRIIHRPGFRRSYHYDIHRYGWMPPAYTYGPGMPPPPLPYYYMRTPGTPAPHPTGAWTPGTDRPQVAPPNSTGRTGTAGRVTTGGNSGHSTGSGSSSSGTRTGSPSDGGNSRGTGTAAGSSSSRGTSTNTSGSSNRGSSTGSNSGSSRGSATTGTTPTRGNTTSASSSSRGSSTAATTDTPTDKPKTNTRGTTAPSSNNRGTSASGSNRGTSTSNRGTNGR